MRGSVEYEAKGKRSVIHKNASFEVSLNSLKRKKKCCDNTLTRVMDIFNHHYVGECIFS